MTMKNKLNQDQVAMIIADWEHGEITECIVDIDCCDCPLNKSLDFGRGIVITMCDLLSCMSSEFQEVEK